MLLPPPPLAAAAAAACFAWGAAFPSIIYALSDIQFPLKHNTTQHDAPQPSQILGLGAAFALSAVLTAAPAKADITAELLVKSAANKELNDKKRLATSSANVARARTVTDGTCAFPNNFFGCEETSAKFTGGVRFIQDDVDLECSGNATGRCASRPNMK